LSTSPIPDTRAQRVANWLMDRKWTTFLIVMVPTLVLAWAIPSIQVYSRFADLLPGDHEYVHTYNRMKDIFGGANVLAMSLEVTDPKTDIFTTATLGKIRMLTSEVDLIRGVNHYQVASLAHPKIRRVYTGEGGVIKSEPVLPRIIPSDAAGLKKLREEALNNDIIYGSYLSTDGRAALIVASFDEERLNYQEIHARMLQLKREVEEDGSTQLYIAGEPMLKGWIYHFASEIGVIFGVTFVVMILLLWIHFRSISGVLVPMLGTAMSALWGLGFVGWMGYNLDPLSLVVPILISARTASHCVQMMERYYDEIRLGRDRETGVRVSMGELLVPATIGIFTDVAGLLVLAVSSIPMIAKMGYYCALWSASNVLTVAVLVPLVMSLLPTPTVSAEPAQRQLPARLMHRLGVFLVGRRASLLIFGITAGLSVGSVYYGWSPPIGESKPGTPLLFPDSQYNIAAAHIASRFAGANQLSIYFEGDKPERMWDPAVVKTMQEFARYMADTPNYGGTRDIPHLVRAINRLYHYDDPRWATLPTTSTDIGNMLFMYQAGSPTPRVIVEYMDPEARIANVVIFYKDATGKTVTEAVAAAKRFFETHKMEGVTPRFAGGIIGLIVAANEETHAADLQTTGLIIVLVMLAVMLTYRSWEPGLLVLVVLGLAVMMNRAFMTLRDIGLNVNTLPVTSVGLGVGVDYAIYMLDRIREEVKHRSLDDAIVVSMRTTGAAVLFTAVMIIGGIVWWIQGSSLRFNSDMALLLCMLLMSNVVGAVTVIPLMIRLMRPRFIMDAHRDESLTEADRARGSVWSLKTP